MKMIRMVLLLLFCSLPVLINTASLGNDKILQNSLRDLDANPGRQQERIKALREQMRAGNNVAIELACAELLGGLSINEEETRTEFLRRLADLGVFLDYKGKDKSTLDLVFVQRPKRRFFLGKTQEGIEIRVSTAKHHDLDLGDLDLGDISVRITNQSGVGYFITSEIYKLGITGLQLENVDFNHQSLPKIFQLVPNLMRLNLSVTNFYNTNLLSELRHLRVLRLAETHIVDIGALANLTELEDLDLSLTQVRDISPLSKLPRLKYLSLYPINTDGIPWLKEAIKRGLYIWR